MHIMVFMKIINIVIEVVVVMVHFIETVTVDPGEMIAVVDVEVILVNPGEMVAEMVEKM